MSNPGQPVDVPDDGSDDDRTQDTSDPSHDVDEVSEESFPSSDPPSTWSSAGQNDT